MKVAFKSVTAAAAFVAVNLAQATVINVPAGGTLNGQTLTGTQTYTAGFQFVGVANVLQATLTDIAPATVKVDSSTSGNGKIANASSTSPVGSLDIDTNGNQILAITGLGGFSLSAPKTPAATGGSVGLSNFRIDLTTKTVYATVSGSNGIGNQNNVAIWTIDNVLGATNLPVLLDGNSTSMNQVSGLHFTQGAVGLFTQALGLNNLGLSALKAVTDAGTIDTTINATMQLTPCKVSIKTKQVRTTPFYDNELTVQNLTGNPATGWTVNWTYDVATLTTAVKNVKLTQKQYVSYTAQPVAANATLAAGASTTATFRSVSVNQGVPAPHNVTASVAGQSCTVSTQ